MNKATFDAALSLLTQRWPFPVTGSEEMQSAYANQLGLEVRSWTGKREDGFKKAVNALVSDQRQFGRPSPEAIVSRALQLAGERPQDANAKPDPERERLQRGYYAIRQYLENGWLTINSRLDDVRHYVRILSPEECRRFWNGMLRHRQCPACGFGISLDCGWHVTEYGERTGDRLWVCMAGTACPDSVGSPADRGLDLEDGSDEATRRASAERVSRGMLWWPPGGSVRTRMLSMLEHDPYYGAVMDEATRRELLEAPQRTNRRAVEVSGCEPIGAGDVVAALAPGELPGGKEERARKMGAEESDDRG